MPIARTQTLVQLSDDLVARLDAEAARRRVSRSALIRTAVEALLEGSAEAARTATIVDGYRRVPPAVPDEWGDLDRAGETAAVEVAQRLDAEERAAGHEPW